MSLSIRSILVLIVAFTSSARADDVEVQLDAGSGFSIRDNTGFVERIRVDEATGNVSRNGVLFIHTTGGGSNTFVGQGAGNPSGSGPNNSAFGQDALLSLTSGASNSAFGFGALRTSTTGTRNTAIGYRALYSNTASYNTALGHRSLFSNTTGIYNVAAGITSLNYNTSGARNVAVGGLALRNNTTGSSNIAIGYFAGANQTTGGNNIYLANTGVAGEAGQIKIGATGTHTQSTIAGIHGRTSAGGIGVLVNASGVLGTTTSSARFKEDVRDMGDASDLLMRLRPVSFRYTAESVGEEDAKTPQYGLIAEEVAEVAPELVAPDLEGRPYSVKYHELPALLVGKSQRQERTIEAQARRIAEQDAVIASLSARVERLEAR
jgi:hypothetical protein